MGRPFHIVGANTPGDLDNEENLSPVFRTPTTHHQICLVYLSGINLRQYSASQYPMR